MGFSAAQSSKSLSGFARNEGLKPQAYELRFFLNAGELPRAPEELIVDIERGTHMHKYAWYRHLLSSATSNIRSNSWQWLRDDAPTLFLLPLRTIQKPPNLAGNCSPAESISKTYR